MDRSRTKHSLDQRNGLFSLIDLVNVKCSDMLVSCEISKHFHFGLMMTVKKKKTRTQNELNENPVNEMCY